MTCEVTATVLLFSSFVSSVTDATAAGVVSTLANEGNGEGEGELTISFASTSLMVKATSVVSSIDVSVSISLSTSPGTLVVGRVGLVELGPEEMGERDVPSSTAGGLVIDVELVSPPSVGFSISVTFNISPMTSLILTSVDESVELFESWVGAIFVSCKFSRGDVVIATVSSSLARDGEIVASLISISEINPSD